jgi:hypothetical protein
MVTMWALRLVRVLALLIVATIGWFLFAVAALMLMELYARWHGQSTGALDPGLFIVFVGVAFVSAIQTVARIERWRQQSDSVRDLPARMRSRSIPSE